MVGPGNVNGEAVTYAWNSATNTLSATSVRGELFTVVVDGGADTGAGNFTFTLKLPLLHTAGGAENDITLPLTYRTTDDDGQFALNTLTVTIDDDTPVANLFQSFSVAITVDESLGENPGEGPEVSDLGSVTVLGAALAVNSSQFGADGAAAVNPTVYSLTLSSNGVDSGLDDTATGNSIFLFNEGGIIRGREGLNPGDAATGDIVFQVSVNAARRRDGDAVPRRRARRHQRPRRSQRRRHARQRRPAGRRRGRSSRPSPMARCR